MSQLTPRELEVLQLIVAGMEDKEAGKALGISHRTVINRLIAARTKTGTRNRTQLAVYAVRTGLVRIDGGTSW